MPNREAATAQGYGHYYDEGFEALHSQGTTMIPYAGQSRGFFTKLQSGGPAGLPADVANMYLNDTNRRRAQAVASLASARGVSVNEVVLAYLMSQPYPTIPIIGAFRHEQLADSIKADGLQLTPKELQQLRG